MPYTDMAVPQTAFFAAPMADGVEYLVGQRSAGFDTVMLASQRQRPVAQAPNRDWTFLFRAIPQMFAPSAQPGVFKTLALSGVNFGPSPHTAPDGPLNAS